MKEGRNKKEKRTFSFQRLKIWPRGDVHYSASHLSNLPKGICLLQIRLLQHQYYRDTKAAWPWALKRPVYFAQHNENIRKRLLQILHLQYFPCRQASCRARSVSHHEPLCEFLNLINGSDANHLSLSCQCSGSRLRKLFSSSGFRPSFWNTHILTTCLKVRQLSCICSYPSDKLTNNTTDQILEIISDLWDIAGYVPVHV